MNERSVRTEQKMSEEEKKATGDKRTAIMESALALIREHGFHGAPMSQVAKNAGVAAGTVYLYFENKCSMINELYEFVRQEQTQAVTKNDNPARPFKDRLFNFWTNYFRFYVSKPDYLFFMEQYLNSPFCNKGRMGYSQAFQEVFTHGVTAGELKPVDIHLFSVVIHGSLANAAKTALSGSYQIADKELQQLFGILWDGIKNNGS